MLCNSDMLHVVFSDWVMLASINWLVCLWLKYYYWVVIFIEHLFSVYGAKKKKKIPNDKSKRSHVQRLAKIFQSHDSKR